MNTLIGLAGHIIFVYSVVNVFLHLNSPIYSYDVIWEAPIVLFTITNIGHSISNSLKQNITKAYEKLKQITNSQTILVKENKEIIVDSRNLKIGDKIIIKKGQMIPIDGVLVSDIAILDYSNITGEDKKNILNKNNFVGSGAYNIGDSFTMIVEKSFQDSNINKLISSIEDIVVLKPKIQITIDRLLKWFIPFVLITSLGTLITWLIIGYVFDYHLPWVSSSSKLTIAIEASVTVLAIACPCALGIATPLVLKATTSIAMNNNILLNNSKVLEKIDSIKYAVFDKTGTLTTKEMMIHQITGNKKYLGILKALENNSEHPIAISIKKHLKKHISMNVKKIKSIENIGMTGIWNKKIVAAKTNHEYKGELTCIGLYIDNEIVLSIELLSKIKDNAKLVIDYLKTQKMTPIIMSGDHSLVVKNVAQKLGINKYYAEINPNQKQKIIKEFQSQGGVMFVGDGFNDALAMKQADLSVAFSSGSEITNYLADVSIIKNEINIVEAVHKLSVINKKKIKISIFWAVMFNMIVIPIAILLLVQPWVGAMIMASSDILIVLNVIHYKYYGNRKIKKIVN